MNDLINYLTGYYKKYGTLPTISDIAKKINKSEEVTLQILDKLKKQGFLGCHEGKYYIKKLDSNNNNNNYNKDSFKNKTAPKEKQIKNIVENIFNKISNKEIREPSDNIIRWVMLFISIACIIVSSYFTSGYTNNYIKGLLCFLLSTSIVAYSSFAFIAAGRLFKKGKIILPILLIFTALIAITISMLSTIAGQYKNNSIKTISNMQSKEIKNTELSENSKNNLQININQNNNQININQERINFLSKIENKSKKEEDEYNRLLSSNTYLKKQRDEWISEQNKIDADLKKLYTNENTTVEKRLDFYAFVETTSKGALKADQVEMWGYIFFACIIDILAPLGLAVFFCDFKSKKEPIIINNNTNITTEPPAQ